MAQQDLFTLWAVVPAVAQQDLLLLWAVVYACVGLVAYSRSIALNSFLQDIVNIPPTPFSVRIHVDGGVGDGEVEGDIIGYF